MSGRRERIAWRHPEWWTVVLSAVAWLVLASESLSSGAADDGVHGHHADAAAGLGSNLAAWRVDSAEWLLMVVAMMFPLVIGSVRITAARSLWRRRHRAIAVFLAGYLVPWLVFGIAVLALAAGLELARWDTRPHAAAAGFTIATVWQLTRCKRHVLASCHRTVPLAPSGWRADRDCLGYGCMIGGRCVVSCGGLMVACVLAGHGMAAMLCATLVAAAERYIKRADQRVTSTVLAAAAVVYALIAIT
ncbi:MAG: DUF2182 domain-containing protein [Vicinamibacterales bacterium]